MGLLDIMSKVLNNNKSELTVTCSPCIVTKREVNVPNEIKEDYRKTLFLCGKYCYKN